MLSITTLSNHQQDVKVAVLPDKIIIKIYLSENKEVTVLI